MKTPAEYVAAAHAKQPIALGPVVPLIVAERAVAAALADAEKYKNLLMSAVRRATPTAPPTTHSLPTADKATQHNG